MKLDELQKIREILNKEEAEVLNIANREYSSDKDALENFKIIGKLLNLPPEKIAAVYWLKHVLGIINYINGNTNQRDSFGGRANDARNYIVLLTGLIREKEYNIEPSHKDV